MPLRVNTNTPAFTAQRLMQTSNRDLQVRLARLSSALRINRAADDAAGLSISERLRADIVGLQQGVQNAQQAINFTQVTEGGLNEVSGLLVRMRELAVQSSSSTLNDNNRAAIQSEFSQLSAEIDRITQSTAPEQPDQTFQIGANATGEGIALKYLSTRLRPAAPNSIWDLPQSQAFKAPSKASPVSIRPPPE